MSFKNAVCSEKIKVQFSDVSYLCNNQLKYDIEKDELVRGPDGLCVRCKDDEVQNLELIFQVIIKRDEWMTYE